MPSVSDFIVDRATARLGDESDPVEVVYRPHSLTADRTEEFLGRVAENDVLAAAYLLTGYGEDDELVVSWTLKYHEKEPLMGRRPKLDENGDPMVDERGRPVKERYIAVPPGEVIPLDPDVLRFLTPGVLTWVFRGLQNDVGRLVNTGFFGMTMTTKSSNGSRPRS